MKAFLFVPQFYSLAEKLQDGFEANGWEAKIIDYKEFFPHKVNRLYEKTAGLPDKITRFWKPAYFKIINNKYLEYCKQEKPDLILIYNNQFFFPDTIKDLKRQSRVVFVLGDNPLWSRTFDFNLAIMKYSDLVISPDSYWKYELSSLGIPNIIVDFPGYSKKMFFKVTDIPVDVKLRYQSDVLYIGRNYTDSSGYKRTFFLSTFSGMGLKIFGTREWHKWIEYFPELIPHFNLIKNRISNVEMNYALNCTKVYPIDQNTGIINGIHLRVFEAIGAGALPVMEWRKDLDDVFEGIIPVIRNYNEAREIVMNYVEDEQKRLDTISRLKQLIEQKYTPELYISRVLNRVD